MSMSAQYAAMMQQIIIQQRQAALGGLQNAAGLFYRGNSIDGIDDLYDRVLRGNKHNKLTYVEELQQETDKYLKDVL